MDFQEQSLFPRIVMGMVAVAILVAICWLFDFNMRSGELNDPRDFQLAGSWKFHNGALSPDAKSEAFDEVVRVPEPLRGQIKNELAEEFWYQKEFILPNKFRESVEPIALFLGGIKGDHEIYWNGQKVSSGGKYSLSITQLGSNQLAQNRIDLRVRVKKIDHLFPGIVHLQPVSIGAQANFERHREFYIFDSGVKPLALGVFKIGLFFLFACLYLGAPRKREYFSFGFFVLCSGLSAICYSRYLPFYGDFFLRNAVAFIFALLSFGLIPCVTADLLRFTGTKRVAMWAFGFSGILITAFAIPFISNRDLLVSLYQFVGRWLPVYVTVPSLVACATLVHQLPTILFHRKIQISFFAAFLFFGALGWFNGGGALMRFSYVAYPELLDVGLFIGLAISAVFDMRYSIKRSERANKVVPKWFSGFLSSGVDQVTLELPMIAVAVDTVGYTRLLSEQDTLGKSELHSKIRARMAPVVERFGAQKLSDRGDGALFGWELSSVAEVRKEQVLMAIAAAEHLVAEGESSVGVKFRVGIAVGLVRGELKGSEVSFLGEPLNAASRLEAMSKPGTVLLHDSVIPYLNPASIEGDWIENEIKGVSYKAVSLKKVA